MTLAPESARRAEPSGETLPRSHRLRKRRDIVGVQDRGERFAVGTLVVMMAPNALGCRRLGVTVSSKVGNAVVRARVKRWLRDVFRKERSLLPGSMDVVLIARSSAPGAGLPRLRADFRKAAAAARSRAGGGGSGGAA